MDASARICATSPSSGHDPNRPVSQCPVSQFGPSLHTSSAAGKTGKGRASHVHRWIADGSTMRPPYTTEIGLFSTLAPRARSNVPSIASRKRRWIMSSRWPLEKYGTPPSADFGSGNTLGWFAPLSTAGQPTSVNQIGLLCGTQAVGAGSSAPPTRSKCGLDQKLHRSLTRNTQGLPSPSVIGVRVCDVRAASSA